MDEHTASELAYKYGKTMPEIAREYELTTERIRIIKNNGLRKLKIGKARKELIERFEILDAGMYRDGLTNFKNNMGSKVEYIAMKRILLQNDYEKAKSYLLNEKEKCI